MAEEDAARENMANALLRVAKIPRRTEREKILWDIIQWCAAQLGIKIEGKE